MNALLQWRAPTHYTNGQTIRVPLTYSVYKFTEHSITEPIDPLLSGIHDTFVIIPVPRGADICFCVRAVTPSGAASPISDIVCRHG